MKLVNSNAASGRPNQPTRCPQTEIPSNSVYGFPVSSNQFQLLQDSQPVVSTSQSQTQDRLIDPRTTRLARLRATRGIDEQGTLGNVSNKGILHTVPLVQDVQGILTNGDVDQLVASGIRSQFFPDSLFVSAPDVLDL